MQYDLLIQNVSSRSATRHIDLEKVLENSRTIFTCYPPFWRLFNNKLSKLKVTFKWQKLNYSSNANPIVTNNTPGIYLFVLEAEPIVL